MSSRSYVLEVLGGFRVQSHGEVIELPASCARLVAFLAVVGDCPRTHVADRLWPDAHPAQRASNLRTALWRLQQRAPGLVRAAGSALVLHSAECDFHSLQHWIHHAIDGVSQPVPPPLGIRRDLLLGWDETWVFDARTELHVLLVHALEAAGSAMLQAGRSGAACEAALAAVALDPFRESAVRLLVDVHLRGGNTVEAVRCYQRFAGLLAMEIGAEPGPALTAMIASHVGAGSAAVLGTDNGRRGHLRPALKRR